ncbi:MAG: ABC transporter permease subunit [Rhodospirillaceae bacterium]|nr:ABC transporter permease subunit [Rhodospirillaceae bacterium]
MNAAARRRAVLTLPWLWTALFFLLPFAVVLKISFAESQLSIPPYTALFERVDGVIVGLRATLANYRMVFTDSLYVTAYFSSLKIAAIATLLTLLLGYPMAYGIARAPASHRVLLLVLVMLPFWTSFLVRIYAWIGLLRPTGIINAALESLGFIDAPLALLNTPGAVYLGIVYAYLPFMVLPLYARLERLDPALLEAAADLGAKPWRAFLHVTLPLSRPGIAAGCLLVFIPAVGEFVIPELLGGPDTLMIGKVLWNEFFSNRDWPLSAAITVVLLMVLVTPIALLQLAQSRTLRRA